MPMPPVIQPPAYWRHNFDLGRFRFVRADEQEEGYAWFEPIDDDMRPDGPNPPSLASLMLTPEARRRRYHIAGMIPCW